MTDARTSAEVAQVAMLVTGVEARNAGQVVQVAMQIERGYVTDMQGRPLQVWNAAGTALLNVYTL